MKNLNSFILSSIALGLSFAPLQANTQNNYVNSSSGCCSSMGNFLDNVGVDLEFLYLTPSVENTTFVEAGNIDNNSNTGKFYNNNFDFFPGFRVGLSKVLDCGQRVSASYTWLYAGQARTVSSPNMYATMGPPIFSQNFVNVNGSAESHLNSLYEALKIDLFTNNDCYSDWALNYFAGLESDYIRLTDTCKYTRTTGVTYTTKEKSRTWTVGPQIGVNVERNFRFFSNPCNTFRVLASASASLLAANLKSDFCNNSVFSASLEHVWKIVSAFRASIGFDYSFAVCSKQCNLGIGYEFNYYSKV